MRLENVSRADAPAVVLAEETIVTQGRQVPIPFTLTYDATQIDVRYHYAVRAQIFYGEQLHWTSTQIYSVFTQSVITQENLATVDILLEQVRN